MKYIGSATIMSIMCLSFGIGASAATRTSPLIVDHTYDISQIPASVWTQLRTSNSVIHYAHRSDGSAVPWGLEHLNSESASLWPYGEGYLSIPTSPAAGMLFWNGMVSEDYITPDLYWQTKAGRDALKTILSNNPAIRYTSWTFCNEDDYWDFTDLGESGSLGSYFRIMDSLEVLYPNVTFIYQTAAMRSTGSEEGNVHQAIFNELIRTWAKQHNKILFDFADLDVWHNGEKNLDTFEFVNAQGITKDTVVPFQHPAWLENNGASNGGHHANDSMGIDKGKAWWYLMARLTGWSPQATPIQKRKSAPSLFVDRERYNLLGQVISKPQ